MEVPRLGVELELQLPAAATARAKQDRSHITAQSNTGSLTHGAGPEIKPKSAWILVGFITVEPQQEFYASHVSSEPPLATPLPSPPEPSVPQWPQHPSLPAPAGHLVNSWVPASTWPLSPNPHL